MYFFFWLLSSAALCGDVGAMSVDAWPGPAWDAPGGGFRGTWVGPDFYVLGLVIWPLTNAALSSGAAPWFERIGNLLALVVRGASGPSVSG